MSLRHWWQEPPNPSLERAGLTLDTAKCAAAFEAARRKPQFWAAVQRGKMPEPWQIFSGLVFVWWSRSWADLEPDQRVRLLVETTSPYFVPPIGYSYFPEDSPSGSSAAAWLPAPLPPNDDCVAAVEFVRLCRRMESAGFLVGGVNNLSAQAVRYALSAIERQPRSFRQADLVGTVLERETPTGAAVAAEVKVLGHVRRGKRWECERHFRFESIMGQFERQDAGGGEADFVRRFRL